jgi:hypothetical protein
MRRPFRLLVVGPLLLLLLLGAGSSLIGAQDIEQQVPETEVDQSDDGFDQDFVGPMPDVLPVQDFPATLDELVPPAGDNTILQADPTVIPQEIPTVEPPLVPEEFPTVEPPVVPEELATLIPEEIPTIVPEEFPTLVPEELATIEPTLEPPLEPTFEPTFEPTLEPTLEPPVVPEEIPTLVPPVVLPVEPTLVPPVEPPVVPDDLDGSGIRYEILPGTTQGGGGQQLQPYLFTFDLYASIPGYPYSEPMIVSVRTGSFAFSAGNENLVVIDAAGAPIPMLATIDDPPHFLERRSVLVDDTGQPCISLCAIPAGQTVLVQPGNTVYLPGGTTCFWCSIDTMGAELEVYAVLPSGAGPKQFSWTQLKGIGTAWAKPGAVRASMLPGLAYGCRGHIGG